MRTKITFSISFTATALLITGCAHISAPHLSRTNPANSNAPEANLSASPVLMTGINYSMKAEAEGAPMDMPDHGSMPMNMSGHAGHQNPTAKPTQPNPTDHHQHNAPKP